MGEGYNEIEIEFYDKDVPLNKKTFDLNIIRDIERKEHRLNIGENIMLYFTSDAIFEILENIKEETKKFVQEQNEIKETNISYWNDLDEETKEAYDHLFEK